MNTYINRSPQVHSIHFPKKSLLQFGATSRKPQTKLSCSNLDETTTKKISLAKLKAQQEISFQNYRKAKKALENCDKNSPEYYAKKMAFNIATEEFAESYMPSINFAIKQGLKIHAQNIQSYLLRECKDDLKNIALLGLFDAEKNYNAPNGDKFNIFATNAIVWDIQRESFGLISTIKNPESEYYQYRRANAILQEQHLNPQDLNLEEICKITKCSKATAKHVKYGIQTTYLQSLNKNSNPSSNLKNNNMDIADSKKRNPLDNAIYLEYIDIFKRELKKLTPRRQEIISTFMNEGKYSKTKTAEIHNLSRERIKQIVDNFEQHLVKILKIEKNSKKPKVQEVVKKTTEVLVKSKKL